MFEELIVTITIYVPSQQQLKQHAEQYGIKYNKDELTNIASSVRKVLLHKKIEFAYDNNTRRPDINFFEKVLSSVYQQKSVLQYFMALMFGDNRNLATYMKNLPPKQILVFKMLLRQGMCLLKEVRKMLGLTEKPSRSYYSWSGLEKLDLPFVEYHASGYDEHFNRIYYVNIIPRFREQLYEALMPEERVLVTTDELPSDLQEACFEHSTITHLPVVQALTEQGTLVRATNKFNANSVKMGVKRLGIDEFFCAFGLPKAMQSLRGSIMLQTIASAWGHIQNKKKKTLFSEKELKKMHDYLCMHPSFLYPILMPHYSGLRPSCYEYFYGYDLMECLTNAINKWEVGKWVEINSIFRRYYQSTAYGEKLAFVESYMLERMTIYNKFNDEERRVYPDQATKELGIPYVKGLFFYMASWGLFDIGCREYDTDDVSPYDTLEYVRLTPLGAYVLGLSDRYDSPVLYEDKAYFELDPNRLIIRSLVDNNPYESLLSDTCTAIQNKRYRMTAETFLAHCSNKEDVEEKISFFKKYISGDLTPVWTEFFDSLLKRCKPFTDISALDYNLFKISPDNQPLIRLLANDEVLRTLVIKAANYIILVPKENKVKFEHRLKSLGYLI